MSIPIFDFSSSITSAVSNIDLTTSTSLTLIINGVSTPGMVKFSSDGTGLIFTSTDGKISLFLPGTNGSQCLNIPQTHPSCTNLSGCKWTNWVDSGNACKYPCSNYTHKQTATCPKPGNCGTIAGTNGATVTYDAAQGIATQNIPCGTIPCATTVQTNGDLVAPCSNTCGTGTETRQPGCIATPMTDTTASFANRSYFAGNRSYYAMPSCNFNPYDDINERF